MGRRSFRLPSDAGLNRDKLFCLSQGESQTRCWRLLATSGCAPTRPASIASPPRFSDDGFADPAHHILHCSAISGCLAVAVAFYLELDNCIGTAPLGCVACGHKRTENSMKVASQIWCFLTVFIHAVGSRDLTSGRREPSRAVGGRRVQEAAHRRKSLMVPASFAPIKR